MTSNYSRQVMSRIPKAWMFVLCVSLMLAGCKNRETVILYAAQDQEYAEPALQQFTRETGIQVLPVYDSEAVKTVGLANRLLAEKARPRCDVFWGNEELRTRQLAANGVFLETNGWTAFGYRSRRIVVNTNKTGALTNSTSFSLLSLTNPEWKGKIAMANPMFGTTCTHMLALREIWGPANWLRWCQALKANSPFLVDGNSQVIKIVGRGDAWIGLTDSDDVAVGLARNLPLAQLPLTGESLLIPNTLGLVRNAPHEASARLLFDFLQRKEQVKDLVDCHALEGDTPRNLPHLEVPWNQVLTNMDAALAEMKTIFLQ